MCIRDRGRATLERLLRTSPCFVVAEVRGRCVGYVEGRIRRARAHIGRLVVAPSHQGRGLGKALLAEALSFLWGLGAQEVTLNTQEDNRVSQRLYLGFGFHPQPDRIPVWERAL